MSYPTHTAQAEPVSSAMAEGTISRSGGLRPNASKRAIQVLASARAEHVHGSGAGIKAGQAIDIPRSTTRAAAARPIGVSGAWLLIYARRRTDLVCSGSVLSLPEHELVLRRSADVDPAGLEGFPGTVLLMPEAPMSPYDKKLFARQARSARFDSAWGRLLRGYLGSLDAETLDLVGKDESDWALVEQHIMALLRRALSDPVNARPWGQRDAHAKDTRSRGELLFEEICTWIAVNFSNPEISTDYVASHFQITPRYIQSLFNSYGDGATFVSFLREKRLRSAWAALSAPGHAPQTISEVCWNCGFADPVHFGKAFREFFGVTPSQARRHGRAATHDAGALRGNSAERA